MNHQKDLSEFNKYHKKHKLAEEEHAELLVSIGSMKQRLISHSYVFL